METVESCQSSIMQTLGSEVISSSLLIKSVKTRTTQKHKTAKRTSALRDNPRVPLKHDSTFYKWAELQTDLVSADI